MIVGYIIYWYTKIPYIDYLKNVYIRINLNASALLISEPVILKQIKIHIMEHILTINSNDSHHYSQTRSNYCMTGSTKLQEAFKL